MKRTSSRGVAELEVRLRGCAASAGQTSLICGSLVYPDEARRRRAKSGVPKGVRNLPYELRIIDSSGVKSTFGG